MQLGLLYRHGYYLSNNKIIKADIEENIASKIWSCVIIKCHQCGCYYILHEKKEVYFNVISEYHPSRIKFIKCKECVIPLVDPDEYNLATSNHRKQHFNNILNGGYLRIF